MIPLPELEEGRTYTRKEVEPYTALQGDQSKHRTDDYGVAASGFPHSDATPWSFDHRMCRPDGVVVVEYHLFPLARFAGWIAERLQHPVTDEDARRMATIEKLLNSGRPAFPVWIEKHQVDMEPIPVREGQHRILVFHKLMMPQIPVFLTKYAERPRT